MTAAQILSELRPLGSDSYKRVIFKHGVAEPCFGVKISELQKIRKRIKKDYRLALDLFATRNYDAQYLAGLIADDAQMNRRDFADWLATANSKPIHSYVIPSVAAGGPHGWELGLEWIDDAREGAQIAGWGTLGGVVALKADDELDLARLKALLQRIAKTIRQQPDRVRYAMNGFLISVGCYVAPLTDLTIQLGEKIGPTEIDMGDTACEVPYPPDYIRKVAAMGRIGKKRKTMKC